MKLTIATHDDQRMVVIQEAVKQFRKENPDVSVVLELVSNKAELIRRLTSGEGPDIVEWEGTNMGQCLDAGILSDLREFILRDKVDMGNYFPCIAQSVESNGRIGAMPVMTETLGVFYNKRHFEEAGLPYPQEGWTWEEFMDTARKLTIRDERGNVIRHGAFTSFGYMLYVEPVVWNCGGSFISEDGVELEGYLNHPSTIEGFRQYLSLIDEGVSPRMGVGQDSWIACFIHEKMSMYLDANWAIKPMSKEQKEKFGVVGFPGGKKHSKSNIFQVYGYGISTTCRNRELAWTFLRKLALPGGGVDKLWTVLNLAANRETAEQSGHKADAMYAVFYKELQYGRDGAYQYPNFIPAFHHNETFDRLVHADDAEHFLQEAVRRTPKITPFDFKSPGWW